MMKTYKILLSLFLILISGMGFSQSVPSYVPTNGLVGWWGFNGNAQDGSGNGNHGTVNGATLTTDRFGNQNAAYDFDAMNSDFIQCGNNNIPRNDTMSISFWFNSRYDFSYHEVICLGSASSTTWGSIIGNNFFAMNYGRGCGSTGSSTASIPLTYNNWHNVTFVSTGLNSISSIYYNGVFISNTTNANASAFCSSANLYFGVDIFSGAEYYDGKLDDIGIWNRALTQQEITNLYNSQLPTQTSLCLPTITTTSPSSVGVDTVVIGGDISNDGGSSIVLRGVCYSTSPNPNMGNQRTEDGSGMGSFNTVLRGLSSSTTYYARSYAKNSNGVVAYGNEVSFTTSASLPGVRCPGTPTVTDIDGNVYNTVQIGSQCWTQSNLKVSKYRNGDNIPTGLSSSDWQNTTSGSYSIYDNDPVNDSLYGKLYNHYAVTDSRGLCPTGWHVPTDGEWTTLENHLGGSSVAGDALRSTATQPTPGGWNPPNTGATNSSGFAALPGGLRATYMYDFGGMTFMGCWWSSSFRTAMEPLTRYLYGSASIVDRGSNVRRMGFSVRCLKNTLPQVNTTSVTNVTPSTALVTGEVISEGDQNTVRGFCYSTTSNPTISNDTTMNGMGLGVYSDTLQNLTPSTTYYFRAYATNSVGTSYGSELNFSTNTSTGFFSCGAVTDIDGNHYQTVLIGSQCWTQSNLRTSRYINGDSVVTGLSDTSWSTTNQGAFVISQYPSDFGFYYNHYAAIDSRGICPTGWRVPSETDWNLLINYVDNLSDTGCINWCEQSTWGAASLKNTYSPGSPANWNPAYLGGAGTNSSGFSSLPAGGISPMGHFMTISVGRWTNYWSTSLINMPNVPTRMLVSDNHKIFKAHESQNYGYSVRCIKNY